MAIGLHSNGAPPATAAPLMVVSFSGQDNSTLSVPTDPIVYVSRMPQLSKYKSRGQVTGNR